MAGAPRRHIFIIDSDSAFVETAHQMLERAGFSVAAFTDPRAALAALASGSPPPALFILDLHLPQKSGAEVIRTIRSEADHLTTPVVVVTALTSESSTLNAFEAGADDVVQKPLSNTELLARVNGQLVRHERFDQLRRQNRDLKLVTEFARVLSQESELPDILRTLIDGLRTALDVRRAAIYLLHEESGELHRALPSDPSRSEGSPKSTLDLRGLPRLADALAARKTSYLDEHETSRLQDAIGGAHPPAHDSSSAVVPMIDRGQLVGVIVCIAERPHLGVTARERFLFSIISHLAAVAVHRARLFHAMLDDHHELDAANRALASTRDFLENVINSSPDAIVASNRAGEIVLYNRAAEQILGWSQDEALGADVRMLYPPGGAEEIFRKLRAEDWGGAGRLERSRETVTDRDGESIPVEISASLITSEGEISAAVGIFTDLRGRLQMEERLQEATENLERSRRRAVAAELAGAAAHELNQPLTSLLAYAELLERRLPEESDHLSTVAAIHREATRVADIVKKIGRITDYRTKEYVGGTRIVDLDHASEPEDDLETSDGEARGPSSSEAAES